MNIQELSCIAQYNLPFKVFIVNNQGMGMVRQWQELLHGGRYSESYTASLPDFVKLAESFHAVGIRCDKASELDDKIMEMIETPRPVVFDCVVVKEENCRSEEHTSELQSLMRISYAVFCLTKKNK